MNFDTIHRIRRHLPSAGLGLTFIGVLVAISVQPRLRPLMLLPGVCTYAAVFAWSLYDDLRRPSPVRRRRFYLSVTLVIALMAIVLCLAVPVMTD